MLNKADVIDMCLEDFDIETYKQLVADDMEELKATLAKQNEETETILANTDAELAKLRKLSAENRK